MKIRVDIGRGLETCPRLSMRLEEEVKNRQNIVHAVVEWPLSIAAYFLCRYDLRVPPGIFDSE